MVDQDGGLDGAFAVRRVRPAPSRKYRSTTVLRGATPSRVKAQIRCRAPAVSHWEKYSAKSKIEPDTGLPSSTTFSSRCQLRGVGISTATLSFNLYCLPFCSKVMVRKFASRRLICPLDHVVPSRQFASSKSAERRAGVLGVDDHFAIGRPGNFDAAVLEVGRDALDGPVAIANRRCRKPGAFRASNSC